ncbi:hypothetical protein VCHC17A1_3926, partial [Vibrio cholerae HC-17A1]
MAQQIIITTPLDFTNSPELKYLNIHLIMPCSA